MNVKLHNSKGTEAKHSTAVQSFWIIIEGLFSVILSLGASIRILLPKKVYDLSYFLNNKTIKFHVSEFIHYVAEPGKEKSILKKLPS